jgi:hypothetical protein
MVRRFAGDLIERHADLLTRDPQLKIRITAMLRRLLPPRPCRSGRPGLASVTAAIRLHNELTQSFPERSSKEVWREVYRVVVPRWDALSPIERRSEADRLHRRVRWRLAAARKRARRARRNGKVED